MHRVKLITFLVSTLFIAPVFPTSIASNLVPKWHVDDSWTYIGEMHFSEDIEFAQVNVDAETRNLCLRVVDDPGENYEAELVGNVRISANVKIEEISLEIKVEIKNLKINGSVWFRKSDLGIEEIFLNISGFLKISIAPLPIPFSGEISCEFDPAFVLMDFPVTLGKQWNTTYTEVYINVSKELIDFIMNLAEIVINFLPQDIAEFLEEFIDIIEEIFPLETVIWEMNLKCIEEKNVTVEAGTYDAYVISVEDTNMLYYAPSVANLIKVLYEDYADITIELKSTTYTPTGAPDKPAKPSGPLRGRIGKEYEYETFAIDPDGNMIQYGWDWDGDGTVDEWTDFYPSGEKIKVSHIWNEKGKYKVRVKARDENGLESKWSDPIEVRIFRSFYELFIPYNVIRILILNLIKSR